LAEAKLINQMLEEVTEIANMLTSGVMKLKNKNF